jgi:hypothetical protein
MVTPVASTSQSINARLLHGDAHQQNPSRHALGWYLGWNPAPSSSKKIRTPRTGSPTSDSAAPSWDTTFVIRTGLDVAWWRDGVAASLLNVPDTGRIVAIRATPAAQRPNRVPDLTTRESGRPVSVLASVCPSPPSPGAGRPVRWRIRPGRGVGSGSSNGRRCATLYHHTDQLRDAALPSM